MISLFRGFDRLELNGDDLRGEPLDRRKAVLAKLLRRSADGIQYIEHVEAVDGATVFAHACKLGLEGIVSKRRDMPYQHGRSRAWLKMKNPACPAAKRIEERLRKYPLELACPLRTERKEPQ